MNNRVEIIYSMKDEISGKLSEVEAKGTHAFHSIGEKVGEATIKIKEMVGAFIGFEAFSKISAFVEESTKSYEDLRRSIGQVNAALESTHHKAGVSASEINEVTEKIFQQSTYTKAQILDANAQLLTFPGITQKVYGTTLEALGDIAARTHHDISMTAIMVGKSLENPAEHLAAMGRYGIVFSAQEKEKIKLLQDSGNLLGAQKVVLEAINNEGYKGSMKAAFDADPLMKFKKEIEEIQVKLGAFVLALREHLVPVAHTVIEAIKGIVHFFQSTSTAAIVVKSIILAVVGGFIAYYTVLGVVKIAQIAYTMYTGVMNAINLVLAASTYGASTAFATLNAVMSANPISLIIIGIAALIAGIMMLWDKCETFRVIIGGVFGFIKGAISIVIDYWKMLGTIIYDVLTFKWGQIGKDAKAGMQNIINDTKSMVGTIKDEAEKAKNSHFKFTGIFAKALGMGKENEKKAQLTGDEENDKKINEFTSAQDKSVSLSTSTNTKQITVNIATVKAADSITLHTININESVDKIEEAITIVLQKAAINFAGQER